jgi:hypothetical protein
MNGHASIGEYSSREIVSRTDFITMKTKISRNGIIGPWSLIDGPAFSRSELCLILGMLTLLAFVVLPALANNRSRSARVICANNLRQIGVAQHLWGNDHDDLPPLMVPVGQGGTRQHSLAPNAWLHFAWLSNELGSAQLIFCPSDTGIPARDFSGDANGGYLHPNFRNGATSYFTSYSGFNSDPQWAVMNGDRNITIDGGATCSLLNSASSISSQPSGGTGGQWKTGLHDLEGNIQFRDGRVAMLPNPELRAVLVGRLDDNGAKHVAISR